MQHFDKSVLLHLLLKTNSINNYQSCKAAFVIAYNNYSLTYVISAKIWFDQL